MDATPIDFNKADGLVAGIVQDAASGEILMLGFLNETSYAHTLATGYVTFWSRSRQKLWMKGETSGNRLRVVSAATDCDNDALLFRVSRRRRRPRLPRRHRLLLHQTHRGHRHRSPKPEAVNA